MAVSSTMFTPELWSDKILDDLKDAYFHAQKPKRSKGAQLLRDAALGHEEFPPDPRATPADFRMESMKNMTATGIAIQQQYAQRAAHAMAQNLDDDILDALRYSMQTNVRIVSS